MLLSHVLPKLNFIFFLSFISIFHLLLAFKQKLPETLTVQQGEKLLLEAEVVNEYMTVKWQKNAKDIEEDSRYQIITKGAINIQ